MSNLRQLTNLVWSIADLLRGHFQASEYAPVLLTFTVLRRLESVRGDEGTTLAELTARPPVSAQELSDYLGAFPSDVRLALEQSGFSQDIQRLDSAGVLHQVVARFADIDLGRETISDVDLGYMFEAILRQFVEQSSDALGEHSTPPDVERLAVQLLLAPDIPDLATTGSPRTAMDPACGIGGFLHRLDEQVAAINPAVELRLFGQEINTQTWAICWLRMMAEGRDLGGIELGNTLSDDRFAGQKFDYLISAPPFGLSWRASADPVRQEYEELGVVGRFGAGLPRISDSSLLFLQHMLSKMKPEGSRVVALFNESAMSVGGIGSGESEIRRWVIENDWLESVTALPDGLLYNTAIPTYLWTLTNRKPADRRGKVVLIDARGQADHMRKPVDSKRQYLTNDQINLIVETYLDTSGAQPDTDHPMHGRTRTIENIELGHQQITFNYSVPADFEFTSPGLAGVVGRAIEPRSVRVPLNIDPDEYLRREILPNHPDARIDHVGIKIGYAISPMLFFQPTLDTRFVPLDEVAERQRARADLIIDEGMLRRLRLEDLDSAHSADELPEIADNTRSMVLCTGGDVVGHGSNWRVIPHGFGDAVTSLTVLRPRGGYGRGLCEWLNSLSEHTTLSSAQRYPPDDLPVPIDLVADHHLDDVLEDVQKSRRTMGEAVSSLLPNVFSGTNRDLLRFREEARSIAVQASLVADAMSSAVDPVWQAEWTYPFHVAALARRYRLSSQPAERKDTLLKLSEGLARTVGILAMTEFVDRGHLPDKLASSFRSGATFNTWLELAERSSQGTTPPKMRELGELRDSIRLIELLRQIKQVRNDSSHAHGVRAAHQLEEEAETLEPLVVSALVTANWLSTVQWDWVEHCQYLDEYSYLLTGRRLRGSHADWEPFERSSTYPMRPGRLYAGTDTTTETGQPVDLTPLAAVRICPQCQAYELFLIDQVRDGQITLRSLEDHYIRVTQSPATAESGGQHESMSD